MGSILTGAFVEMAQHPHEQDYLREALLSTTATKVHDTSTSDFLEEFQGLDYQPYQNRILGHAIREVWRLHPPSPADGWWKIQDAPLAIPGLTIYQEESETNPKDNQNNTNQTRRTIDWESSCTIPPHSLVYLPLSVLQHDSVLWGHLGDDNTADLQGNPLTPATFNFSSRWEYATQAQLSHYLLLPHLCRALLQRNQGRLAQQVHFATIGLEVVLSTIIPQWNLAMSTTTKMPSNNSHPNQPNDPMFLSVSKITCEEVEAPPRTSTPPPCVMEEPPEKQTPLWSGRHRNRVVLG
uniref:Uncharacterized protein n=1 Tax=Entomoneis paludosa TaxID=265537 RepID=A0A7S2YKE7_9STRA